MTVRYLAASVAIMLFGDAVVWVLQPDWDGIDHIFCIFCKLLRLGGHLRFVCIGVKRRFSVYTCQIVRLALFG